MTNPQILQKAFKKAKDNGYKDELPIYDEFSKRWVLETDGSYVDASINDYIFDHEFAKALWGESNVMKFPRGEVHLQTPAWQYHLQQLAISEDLFKYIEGTL
jgi:hypothetical protein